MNKRTYIDKWTEGNNRGEGYAVGHEDDDINAIEGLGELIDCADTDDDIAIYRTATGLVGVGNANGPWAVDISDPDVHRYAAYDDDGIWSTVYSREKALAGLAGFQAFGGLDDEEMAQIGLRVAPMTERLAMMVAEKGYDCLHPAYGWRILPGGMLDLDED